MGYRGKVREHGQARDLRADGWTLTEIAAEVGASKSSVSLWVRDVEIDAEVLARRRYDRWRKGNEGARRLGPNKLQRNKQAEIDRFLAEGRDRIGRLNAKESSSRGPLCTRPKDRSGMARSSSPTAIRG